MFVFENKVWKITLEGNDYRIGNFTIIQLISGKYTREKSVVKETWLSGQTIVYTRMTYLTDWTEGQFTSKKKGLLIF